MAVVINSADFSANGLICDYHVYILSATPPDVLYARGHVFQLFLFCARALGEMLVPPSPRIGWPTLHGQLEHVLQ